MTIRLPTDTEHHAVFGMNGSGKTVFGLYCLSKRSFHRMPWIIFDTKREPLITEIPRITEIGVNDKIPRAKGLYYVRPSVHDMDEGNATSMLFRIWEKEKCGVYVDEAYSFGQYDKGIKACLTQGRSKRVPMMILSQKPSWISPFVHSECSFKSVFFLHMQADIKRVQEWIPGCDPSRLQPHWSYFHSVKARSTVLLRPCPDENGVLNSFDGRGVRRTYI